MDLGLGSPTCLGDDKPRGDRLLRICGLFLPPAAVGVFIGEVLGPDITGRCMMGVPPLWLSVDATKDADVINFLVVRMVVPYFPALKLLKIRSLESFLRILQDLRIIERFFTNSSGTSRAGKYCNVEQEIFACTIFAF